MGEVIGLSVGGSTLLLIVIVVAITIVLVALIYKRKYKKSGELCPYTVQSVLVIEFVIVLNDSVQ